jgi:fructose 1,6-bisphosphate aldolase/phosphatase
VALGYQITGGRLIGPRDMFDNPSFDRARQLSNEMYDSFCRHGPFSLGEALDLVG